MSTVLSTREKFNGKRIEAKTNVFQSICDVTMLKYNDEALVSLADVVDNFFDCRSASQWIDDLNGLLQAYLRDETINGNNDISNHVQNTVFGVLELSKFLTQLNEVRSIKSDTLENLPILEKLSLEEITKS